MWSPTHWGSIGWVAPEVTNGLPASWNRGAAAITKVVSEKPIAATTSSLSRRCAALAVSCWSVLVSIAITSIGRPSEQSAGLVDLLGGELRAAQRRPVDRGHAAGQVVERADLDRLLGHAGRGEGCRQRKRRGPGDPPASHGSPSLVAAGRSRPARGDAGAIQATPAEPCQRGGSKPAGPGAVRPRPAARGAPYPQAAPARRCRTGPAGAGAASRIRPSAISTWLRP